MKNYWYYIIGVLLLASGIAIGKFTLPAKIVTKTVTQTVTQVVTKTQEVDKTDYYKNRVLIETTTTKPDGTIVKQKEFVDKDSYHKVDTTASNTQTNTTTNTSTSTSKTYANQNGSVKLLYAKNFSNLTNDIYGLEIDKKLIGPFSIAAFGLTDKTFGAGLGINF